MHWCLTVSWKQPCVNEIGPFDLTCITYVLRSAEYTTIKLSFGNCGFSRDDAVALLKGVGDHQLSLIVWYVMMYMYHCCAYIMSHHCSNYSTTGRVKLCSQCWMLSVLSQCPVWLNYCEFILSVCMHMVCVAIVHVFLVAPVYLVSQADWFMVMKQTKSINSWWCCVA